jgi:hypothetical protein
MHLSLDMCWVTHIINTKIIQRLGDLNLLLGIEKGIGKLFALSKGTFDNLEVRYIAQVVANWLVWVRTSRMGVRLGLDGGEARVSLN